MPPIADPDFELLRCWRDGDRRAGNELVGKYYDQVRAFFINAVDDDERQDLTNETFRRLMGAMKNFEQRASFRTFLFRIARNSLNDHLRRRYRRESQGFDPLTHSVEDVGGETPSRAVAELERYRHLVACLRALPVEIKQMIELYYWHDCTADQLAEVYDVEPTTIRTRLHAARKRLTEALARGLNARRIDDDEDFEQDLRAVGALLCSGPQRI